MTSNDLARSLEAVVVFHGDRPPSPSELTDELDAVAAGLDRVPAEHAVRISTLPHAQPPPSTHALLFSCAAVNGPPCDRPALLYRVLSRLTACGAISAWLPAASKWLDASDMAALAAMPAESAYETMLTMHAVAVGDELWLHTHGMQQFELPDLECRVAPPVSELASRLVDNVARYLIGGGRTVVPGALLEGPDPQGPVRFAVDVAAVPDDHPFGRLGAWTLSLNPP